MNTVPMHPVVKQLLAVRALRSIGQGAMVVDLTLYLKDLHWSGAAIGGVTSAAGLVGAALILVVGILSDRIGRKPFLLIYEALTTISAVVASFTTLGLVLILAIVLAGFGRGQSGAAGPFSPAEQALLARHVARPDRGRVFSLNNAVGFIGMAIGSLLGGLPALLRQTPPLVAYRPVFWTVAALSMVCVLVISRIREEKIRSLPSEESTGQQGLQNSRQIDGTGPVPIVTIEQGQGQGASTGAFAAQSSPQDEERQIRKQENRSLLTLALVNVLNGLAVGLTGPMMAYWFSLRYGASTAQIGATLSISFLLTGVFSIVSGRMASRIGMVKSVTWMRVLGSAAMLVLPFMPNFALASVLFVVRNAVNRGTQGNRTALGASLTRDKRRGLATSINALSMRLPASIGPTVTGYLFDADLLSLPLILTAVLQLINAGIYQRVFGAYDRKAQVGAEG
ncbi:MAG: MFS transporter [Firmicutes bacterium]|nr:MFS transporter [Bacillota bacterium]